MSIRTKLTLALLLVSLLGAGATGAALIYGSYRAQLEQIAEKKLLLVEDRAHRLEDDLEQVRGELIRLSTLAEVDLADGDLEPEKRVLRYARKDSALFQMQVLLLNAEGVLLWAEPARGPLLGQPFGGQGWFQALRAAGGQSVIDDPGDTLRISVPIMRGERFSGALVGLLDRSRPDLLTRKAPLDLAKSASAAVLSRDGALRFDFGNPAGFSVLRASRAASSALAGQTGRFWDQDGTGRGWLFAFAPIPAAHWALVVREARDELDDDLDHELRIFSLLLLGGLGLALVVGLSLARLITRPLAALSEQATAIANGQLPGAEARPPPGLAAAPHDELEAFAQAFAEMGRAIGLRDREIREAKLTLEHKVDLRTAELRGIQEQLLVSNRFAAMGKTAAAIAHELKNALNGLGLSIDLLTQGPLAKDRGDAIRIQVREEIARLRDISDNLNLFGVAPRLALAPIDLHQLLFRTLALLQPQIERSGVAVELNLAGPDQPLEVRGDAQKLQTTLLNLCKNAIEAMEPASFGDSLDSAPSARPRRLGLRSGPEGNGVFLEIADTGAGLSVEARRRLFEPFFTTKRTGTGLGLIIAQRVVEAHHGHLTVEDRGGGGTIFRLWLAREPAPAEAESSPAPAELVH